MHILHVLNTLGAGGAEAYVVHLSNDLARRGARVTVAAGGRDITLATQLHPRIEVLQIAPSIGGSAGLISAVPRMLLEVPKLARLLRSSEVTAVHTHLIASATPFWMAGRSAGVPSVHTAMHTRDVASRSERLAWDSRIPARLASRFLALSDWFHGELIGKWHIPASRVTTIRSGIDIARFRPDAEARDKSRAEWGAGPGTLVCGAVASLTPVKGLELAIDSIAHAAKIGVEDLLFVVAGKGPEEENLRSLAAKNGIACRVLFLGYVKDPSPILPGFDVYLQTTVGPNLGFSSLEALSSGVPLIIATRSTEEVAMGRDTLITDDSGWVEDATPLAIGRRLLQLYSDPVLLSRKKIRAREIALAHYDWESHVERLLSLYESLEKQQR